MTNNLTLEQILGVVQKKYPEAEIKEEDQYSIISKHNSIYYVSYNNKRIWLNDFDNLIELKHYLDIEIKWEDLKEYSKHLGISNRKLEDDLCFKGLSFSKHGTIRDCEDDKIVSNRSYWRMYNIIKNLIEE